MINIGRHINFSFILMATDAYWLLSRSRSNVSTSAMLKEPQLPLNFVTRHLKKFKLVLRPFTKYPAPSGMLMIFSTLSLKNSSQALVAPGHTFNP